MGVFAAEYLSCFAPTSVLKNDANDFTNEVEKGHATDSSESERIRTELLLEAHRKNLPPRTVQFLPDLSFPIAGSRDPSGCRYFLWRPVVLMLQQGWRIEIEEWLCGGEVGLVFVPNDAIGILGKVIPEIERSRIDRPYNDALSSLHIVLTALSSIEHTLESTDPLLGPIRNLQLAFRSFIRKGVGEAKRRRAELILAAEYSPDWAVLVCVEFLRASQGQQRVDDSRSLMLASEGSLASEWLTSGEDDAWRDL
jgi:hypothetical protein